MDVKNCRRCRRLFNYIGGQPICPQCREELEKKFQEVKKYLFDNRNSTIRDVVENCDVEESQVRQWVREERLEFSSGIDVGVVCENCGAPITSGRFCDKCKAAMINDLQAAGRKPEVAAPKPDKRQTHENKMRFLNQQ
ncbi:MAG: flagellar protein [Lachnospiraceae bacterium]|nr:flagellar protein [Lachnospiraceae bacterium]